MYRSLSRTITAALALLISATSPVFAAPSKQEVLAAMRRAADFMASTVACRGGYLWNYSVDLTEQWGEAPARTTQIWVQSATPDAGELFIEAWKATSDATYLNYAERVANALIYGQHPLGGWHYVIDFDKPGLEQWYRDVFSQFKWGMEEYRHYYGNCAYDDDTTQGATRFLLHLYMATLDPAYREPLLRALDFILMSQYPNGAWPQRYPLRYEFVHDGLADYTSYYTMNDNSMRDILNVLIEAWEQLGDERYLKAALRGADFMIMAQGPENQAGWAEQYDMNMQPAWARTHEPAGYMPRQTEQCILQLGQFYLMTGDRRYLKPIPVALGWLEKSSFGRTENGRYKLARYYEVGTNTPIYQHKTDEVNELGYGLYTYNSDPTGVSGGWVFTEVDIDRLRKGYEEVSALSPEKAVARYKESKSREPRVTKVDPGRVEEIIKAMDTRGAWVEEIRVYDTAITMKALEPSKAIQGIAISRFINNMRTLINYVRVK